MTDYDRAIKRIKRIIFNVVVITLFILWVYWFLFLTREIYLF